MEPPQEGTGPDGPEPEAPDWIPVMLGFGRDRSADGWAFTRVSDVREALADRQLVGAVAHEGPRAIEDMIVARLGVNVEGHVATLPDPAGPPVAGAHVQEVVSELAWRMKTVILVDGTLPIGTAGVPLDEIPPGMTPMTGDRRHVYLWPGTERHVAAASLLGLQEEVTWHDAAGWTVLASVFAAERILTAPPPTTGAYPFVTLTRVGPERRFEYAAGKGKEDLRLLAWWAPWLEPVVEVAGAQEETRALLERLAHPRFGEDEMDPHSGLTEEQRVAVGTAMGDPDGEAFFWRVCAAFGLPEIAARLAEQRADEVDPSLAGETMRPESRLTVARAAMKAARTSEEDSPLERTLGLWGDSIELVVGLVFLASLVWDFLPGPWWIWLVLGLFLVGDGLKGLVIDPRRRKRRQTLTGAED